MQQDILPHLFKTEQRKIISVLYKLFGLEHIEIAEDIVSDVFLLAAETWGLKGLPDNPTAWLYTVSKNRTKDYLKRNNIFRDKIKPQLSRGSATSPEIEIDLSEKNITDSQLQMMFAVCHPSLPFEAQVGLSLRILCGFSIDEIARAFLSNRETINKRLSRAKEKLRDGNIKIEFPGKAEISKRLETVSTTLYLLFNEGYYSSRADTVLRKDLCLEAMRLTHLLLDNEHTDLPAVNALFSLMCFHASRFDARTNERGESVLYHDQDETLWNSELIRQGEYFLNRASTGDQLSKFHLEAAIAYWHTIKADTREKWENILQLYNRLLQIEYSPVAALNRTYALSKARSKAEAIIEAEKLKLSNNHLYHSLLGDLYLDIDNAKAVGHLQKAMEMTNSVSDKAILSKKILSV